MHPSSKIIVYIISIFCLFSLSYASEKEKRQKQGEERPALNPEKLFNAAISSGLLDMTKLLRTINEVNQDGTSTPQSCPRAIRPPSANKTELKTPSQPGRQIQLNNVNRTVSAFSPTKLRSSPNSVITLTASRLSPFTTTTPPNTPANLTPTATNQEKMGQLPMATPLLPRGESMISQKGSKEIDLFHRTGAQTVITATQDSQAMQIIVNQPKQMPAHVAALTNVTDIQMRAPIIRKSELKKSTSEHIQELRIQRIEEFMYKGAQKRKWLLNRRRLRKN